MANDGYKGPASSDVLPTSHQPFEEREQERQRPASYYPPSAYPQYPFEPSRPRSRASSIARSDISQPQPIHDAANAVNTAFDRSDAAARVDPGLIAQITEQVRKQVIDSLKESGIGTAPVKQPQPPHATASNNPSFPARNVYTPPSPTRQDFATHVSSSPDATQSSRDPAWESNHDTPTPKHANNENVPPRNMSTSSSTSVDPASKARPAAAPREPTDGETTTVEKIWQPLFDSDNQPTHRLSQFLRGLANHIIDDYEPKRSIVISPAKMAKFYDDVKLPTELFPWNAIWRLPNPVISKMYRDLRCEHHLIQDFLDRVPHIPGLTADGFRTWMTAMIMAHPDLEAQRLAKAVLDMPISNADDCKERFPKELPRRLFPKIDNLHAQQRCAAALSCDGRIPVPRATFPPPPPLQTQTQAQTQAQSSFERERSPYTHAPTDHPMSATTTSSSAVTDSDFEEEPPSIPLERERKPYTAKEGSGKFYEEDLSSSSHSTARTDPGPMPIRNDRTQSFTGQRPGNGSTWPIPPHSSSHRNTVGEYPPGGAIPPTGRHYRQNSTTMNGGRRPRSPSFSGPGKSAGGYGTRSDSNIGDIPNNFYQSNINIYDADEEARKHAARRQAEDAARYGASARTVYDDDYHRERGGSNGYGHAGGGGAPGYGYGSSRY